MATLVPFRACPSFRFGALVLAALVPLSEQTSTSFICSAPAPALGVRRPAPRQSGAGTIDLQSVGDLRCKWSTGRLAVGFYGGSGQAQQRVLDIAAEWEQYARVQFRRAPVETADIRITFSPGNGNASAIGSCTAPGPTMNYKRAPTTGNSATGLASRKASASSVTGMATARTTSPSGGATGS